MFFTLPAPTPPHELSRIFLQSTNKEKKLLLKTPKLSFPPGKKKRLIWSQETVLHSSSLLLHRSETGGHIFLRRLTKADIVYEAQSLTREQNTQDQGHIPTPYCIN